MIPKGDRSQALPNGNDVSDYPSHLKANKTDDRDETIKHIEFCDRQLDALDRKARTLSVKTNWTYRHLGKAYEAFCVVITLPAMSLVSPLAGHSTNYHQFPYYHVISQCFPLNGH
jgi:hypothetical protein